MGRIPSSRTPEVPSDLAPVVLERHVRGAAAWPGVTVDMQQFVRAVADRLDPRDPRRSVDAMLTDDLYLACGCAAGDREAIAAFERHCGPAIARALATVGASAEERADLRQVVRQRLLVARSDGDPPRIASYAARGSLAAWVRVVAAREAERMMPRARREVAAENDELVHLLAADGDLEIGYLKRLYRDEFKRAFQVAIEALDDRARLVLRQHALDGLTIDQLAPLHRVHRATAARWVQGARDHVLAFTERELIRKLRLTRNELASVMRLIHSRLEVSLERLLASDTRESRW
jgi:RNA polymerase sigma-70 factor (ECF subfamily)